ncbi:MAG: BT_3928 family protein [Ferruginibacter sp.]
MKKSVTIARIIVGVLFIFSGLIKAIDPLGLTYKMQEFFEVWSADGHMVWVMDALHSHAIILSSVMITLEVLLGVALLIGWQKRFVLWVLLVMMVFFMFLTSYVLFSGKIRECGCFGNCIPLTPLQTFIKDVILLVLIIFIIINKKYIQPVFASVHLVTLILGSAMITALLQSHALEHLPLIDCLPYKQGNNILALRQTPADATFDKYTYSFVYKKGTEQKEFTVNDLPDSTWQFVQQNKILIEKGNDKEPAIKDFSLTDAAGNDSTEAVLGQKGEYYLFFLKDIVNDKNNWEGQFSYLSQNVKLKNRKIYIVTADREHVDSFFNIKNHYNLPVYVCDATAIKTAARCNPTLFLMNGPVVEGKWSWLDIQDGLQ